MTNVQACCYGEHPTVERPSNDKYAFLCVFHTLLKGMKKRRSFSAELPTVSTLYFQRDQERCFYSSAQIMSKLCTTTTLPGDGRPLFFGPLMGPRTVFGICHRSAVLSWNSRQGAVEEFRLDNSVSYAFDDDDLNECRNGEIFSNSFVSRLAIQRKLWKWSDILVQCWLQK